MHSIVLRTLALALVLILPACGAEPLEAAPETPATPLPVAGPSWIAGDRTAPTAGRVVVGLLVNRRAPQRLADLVPKAKLDAYLKGDRLEEPQPVEYGDWVGASHHAWGPQALHLAEVRDAFRTQHGIELEFREVLAEEVQGLPLVLAERLPAGDHERRPLRAYKESGGRLRIPIALFLPKDGKRKDDGLRAAIRGAIETSPFIHVLPSDPFALEARRDGDELVITTPMAGVSLALENGAGETVASATAVADAPRTFRVDAPDPALNPFAHTVRATWRGQGLALTRGWAVADLVGTLEREIYGAREVHAGGVLALRIRARQSHDSAPLPDQTGRVELKIGIKTIAAADYRTGTDGLAHPRLRVPVNAAPGRAEVHVDGVYWLVEITPGQRVSVVSDRPLYKQTDTVRVRAMVHRAGDGRPVAGAAVELAVGDAKRIVTTSEHGIASHAFRLQDHAVGALAVTAKAGGATATNRARVKAFERPTFTLAAEPEVLRLAPGQTAPLRITATYVNGSPLVDGRFTVERSDGVRLQAVPEQTGGDGSVTLDVQAQSRSPYGTVVVSVKDAEGRRQELTVPVEIELDDIRLGVQVVSDLAVGVPARFVVTASEPTTVAIGGGLEGPSEVVVGEAGHATVTLTPTRRSHMLRLIARGTSTSVEQELTAAAPTDDAYVLAFDRRVGRVGETLEATVLGPDGVVEIDAWKDATSVFTTSVSVTNGRAAVELPLDGSMAGVLRVYTHSPDRKRTAPRATLLVTRGRALEVTATPRGESYAPGETARVDVTVRDKDGQPTSAVLGYWGVDEALLALAPLPVGHERVFDALGRAPDATRLALAEQTDRGAPVAGGDLARTFGDRAKGTEHVRAFPVVIARTPDLRAVASSQHEIRVQEHLGLLFRAYGAAWADIPLTDLVSADTLRETLAWLAARDAFDPELLKDPWGTPYLSWADRNHVELRWRSAGPDRRFYTPDDLDVPWSGTALHSGLPQRVRDFHAFVRRHHDPARLRTGEDRPKVQDAEFFDMDDAGPEMGAQIDGAMGADAVARKMMEIDEAMARQQLQNAGLAAPPPGAAFEGPSTNSAIGLGGGAGGAFSGRGGGGRRSLHGGSSPVRPPPYVRRDFDPTLCFVPEHIVGPEGKTTLEIPLKDSMTTWRLRLVASRADGATGVGQGHIRVKQPVHATPWLSPHLTVGDVIELPVAIRNEERRGVSARVTATASRHLAELSEPSLVLDVGPAGTARATFTYRAKESGRATVRITVDTGAAEDVQERVVHVHRHARTVVAVASGNIALDAPMETGGLGDGPGDVRLDVYPSPLADVQSGFEGLIGAPHG